MSDLTCAKCGVTMTYADAHTADLLESCDPRYKFGQMIRGSGSKHQWREA